VTSSVNQEHCNPENEVQELITTQQKSSQWKRIILLIVAITVHNVPGKCNDQVVIHTLPKDWIHLAQDSDQWQAVVNMVINLQGIS